MTASPADVLRHVIDETDQLPNWDDFDGDVQKIVLGTSPSGQSRGDSKLFAIPSLPDNLAARFPNLTHLYLWQIGQLQHLPELPAGLRCLEIRNCPDLESIANLPTGLETLVVEHCPKLRELPLADASGFDSLTELSVAGLGLSGELIERLLAAAGRLTHFDASSCANLAHISRWPENLERIELKDCKNLTALPAIWPRRLRRLGLRGCSRLTRIADFPATIDFVDLAYTDNLTALPDQRRSPRTLYLYESGILMPPASEHGGGPDANVARRTQGYFEDVELFGRGSVLRCKLLILGNGAAGKTCLAGSLVTNQPQQHAPDSTHGVQFWDWPFATQVDGVVQPIQLHLWDFGGQEIYHNTHRLFISKGAVFVLVWNPDQDGKLATISDSDYQDQWRPLRYWLDMIHAACPHRPSIAIVCSHHTAPSDELKARLRDEIGDEYFRQHPCYFHDSVKNQGEKKQLVEWLKGAVGSVVRTQGTAVPAHWEIAQNMITRWLPKLESGSRDSTKPQYTHLKPDEFRELLYAGVIDDIELDRAGKYATLKQVCEDGRFDLTDDRVTRTLEFLTHSGWVYWNSNLFEGQAIIGQRWALDAIYTVLDRRPNSEIYRRLCASHGQFTRQDLNDWIWGTKYEPDEQKLLISFMMSVGVIFRLVSETESYWREPVYKSFEHLPSSELLDFKTQFRRHLDGVDQHEISVAGKFHEGDWHAILKNLGETYGTDALYAKDGFFLHNNKDQHTYWIEADLNENELRGEIELRVAGPNAKERCESVAAHVRSYLPDRRGDGTRGAREFAHVAGERPEHTQVFFTYAWDPQDVSIPPGYEKPVVALYEAIKADPAITPLYDKKQMTSGDSITQFMARIKQADKVLVIHSDKYWTSPFCMYEFTTAVDRREEFADFLIMIGHLNSGITNSSGQCQQYIDHWESRQDMHNMLNVDTDLRKLQTAALHAFRNQIPQIAGILDINRDWTDAAANDVIAWVKKKLED